VEMCDVMPLPSRSSKPGDEIWKLKKCCKTQVRKKKEAI
jgi:hypothetical protein